MNLINTNFWDGFFADHTFRSLMLNVEQQAKWLKEQNFSVRNMSLIAIYFVRWKNQHIKQLTVVDTVCDWIEEFIDAKDESKLELAKKIEKNMSRILGHYHFGQQLTQHDYQFYLEYVAIEFVLRNVFTLNNAAIIDDRHQTIENSDIGFDESADESDRNYVSFEITLRNYVSFEITLNNCYALFAVCYFRSLIKSLEGINWQERFFSLFTEPPNWNPNYHTTTAIELAHTIYNTKDWNLCPVLADALMDAGCEDEYILWLLTKKNMMFQRGVWILDKLMNKFG